MRIRLRNSTFGLLPIVLFYVAAAQAALEIPEEESLPEPPASRVPAQQGSFSESPEIPKQDTQQTTVRRNRGPKFQDERPNWGFQVHVSPSVFGYSQPTATVQGPVSLYHVIGVTFAPQYQPAFLQDIGVLGVGPSFSVLTSSAFSHPPAAIGVQATYQARFFRNQWVVPIGGISYSYLHYSLNLPSGAVVGNSWILEPYFGLWVFLNVLEPHAAAGSFVNWGILRSYLTLEAHSPSISPSSFVTTGLSYFLGLRLEI